MATCRKQWRLFLFPQTCFEPAAPAGAAAAARGAEAAQAGPSSSGRGHGAQEGWGHGAAGSSLWVHKYAPKTFWDLLSDEQINRWVVEWVVGEAGWLGVNMRIHLRPSGTCSDLLSDEQINRCVYQMCGGVVGEWMGGWGWGVGV